MNPLTTGDEVFYSPLITISLLFDNQKNFSWPDYSQPDFAHIQNVYLSRFI